MADEPLDTPDQPSQPAAQPESENDAAPTVNEHKPEQSSAEPTDEKALTQSKLKLLRRLKPKFINKPSKKSLLIAVVIILNLGIAGTGTGLVLASTKQKPARHEATVVTSETDPAALASNEPTEAPKITLLHYKADALKAKFDYPSDWHISGNPDNTFISIQSPVTKIKDYNNTLSDAQVSINITAKYTGDQSNTIDANSHITAASDELTYNHPTKVQRTTTHYSYAQLPGDNDPASISSSFISGNLAYSIGDRVGLRNFKAINPFITIVVQRCDTTCDQPTYLGLNFDDYTSNPLLQTAKDIIKSFEFN
jgi:hypothetical protein